MDVSAWQPKINWSTAKANGARFAYIKATEGVHYRSSTFTSQFSGARAVGIARGAYHFARPDVSSAARQADYFVAYGGSWKVDGHTLPGVLDIESNPYGAKCYGLTRSRMVLWIHNFVTEYHAKTSRWPVINTFTDWWTLCTGNSSAFAATDPLWVNNHHSTAGVLPAGWGTYTVWQWADHGVLPGDQDVIPSAAFARLLSK
jgi:GH25 family lysozyme M1 (1,4-beta-N-acetylmuramidase)